ncbi:MAG: hypothetical protein HOW73_19045 [Polyangiaceae bacterium]|nr:hypothetical protein [Polyangiaceae bacterium]
MKDERRNEASRLDLDELLRDASIPPLPSGATDDASWDEHGDAIMARLSSAGPGDAATLDALLAVPALEREENEPGGDTERGGNNLLGSAGAAVVQRGVANMADSDRPKPSIRAGGRPSLKELAERVSKNPAPSSAGPASLRTPVPAPPSSLSAVATPPPSSLRTPTPPTTPSPKISDAPPSVSAASARQSAPPPSGVAVSVKPSEPESSKDAKAAPAPVIPIEVAKTKAAQPEKSGGGGGMAGLLIAGLGIAAAAGLFFFLKTGDASKNQTAKNTPATVETTAPTATATEEAVAPEPTQQAEATQPEEKKDDGALDLADLADASASVSAPTGGPHAGPASTVASNDTASKDPKQPFVPNPDGTLDEAMRKAAGDPNKTEETPQPAAQETGPKNLPDQPPQGSISAYVASVRGAAKACVAGADEQSVATVTFGSNGSVQRVSVGGWAAGKGAASCIEGAMKGGRVEAFTKPSYSFSVPIRP